MRLLQDSSRPRVFLVASTILVKSMFFPFRSSLHCPSRSSSVSLCFSFLLHVHVKLYLVVFSPPSFPRVQTTSLLFLIFCTTVSSAPSSSLVCSFLTF